MRQYEPKGRRPQRVSAHPGKLRPGDSLPGTVDDFDLPVRSPLMAKVSWPRFLAPGDKVEVPITIFNKTKLDGKIDLSFDIKGPISLKLKGPIND